MVVAAAAVVVVVVVVVVAATATATAAARSMPWEKWKLMLNGKTLPASLPKMPTRRAREGWKPPSYGVEQRVW